MMEVLFKDKATANVSTKFLSLFPGLGYAAGECREQPLLMSLPTFTPSTLYAGYKVLQRIYKFGGQPYFNDYLTNHYKPWFQKTFGDRNGKSMMSATAGR